MFVASNKKTLLPLLHSKLHKQARALPFVKFRLVGATYTILFSPFPVKAEARTQSYIDQKRQMR